MKELRTGHNNGHGPRRTSLTRSIQAEAALSVTHLRVQPSVSFPGARCSDCTTLSEAAPDPLLYGKKNSIGAGSYLLFITWT
jgi:hypothetical protein